MPLISLLSIENVLAACIIILAIAVLVHVFKTRRRLEAINFEEIERRLRELEKKAVEAATSCDQLRRNLAEVTIKTKTLEHDLAAVQEESSRFLNIFKTVLYGFDYIVQGCKSALEISPEEKRPEAKRIIPE
ncbi:MAG: hypothetical protein NTZ78_04625 [Candidatus Aureabacteria bacterium]|nr:hypothetical protein [Candidatus Auribacterota bacterium]